MNLTISIDDRILERARKVARKRGISLQELLRRYLESLAGMPGADETADRIRELMSDYGGRSGGAPIKRDDAYDDRIGS